MQNTSASEIFCFFRVFCVRGKNSGWRLELRGETTNVKHEGSVRNYSIR